MAPTIGKLRISGLLLGICLGIGSAMILGLVVWAVRRRQKRARNPVVKPPSPVQAEEGRGKLARAPRAEDDRITGGFVKPRTEKLYDGKAVARDYQAGSSAMVAALDERRNIGPSPEGPQDTSSLRKEIDALLSRSFDSLGGPPTPRHRKVLHLLKQMILLVEAVNGEVSGLGGNGSAPLTPGSRSRRQLRTQTQEIQKLLLDVDADALLLDYSSEDANRIDQVRQCVASMVGEAVNSWTRISGGDVDSGARAIRRSTSRGGADVAASWAVQERASESGAPPPYVPTAVFPTN
ncbi:hypothetical protein DFP72DRAFT_295983 [Ephemerocybe angulata]|uniref:Uncharacterized protein n=1 Tax=Ephemerocybe angulata TaxID=980116 RepID=A0A8H6I032_9AGAR|nr:hypothetical protein DFP72DRAFT_295983 [Tulosesus angulatus]